MTKKSSFTMAEVWENLSAPTLPHVGGKNCLMSRANLAIREWASAKGFTLAEVLITLGIIGVVAAITMPVIKSKIEKIILRQQFLKQYNNIVSIRKIIETESGDIIQCYAISLPFKAFNTDCNSFWTSFFEKTKVAKTCRYGSEGCSPTYKTMEEVAAEGGRYNGTREYIDKKAYTAHILADGAIIYVPNDYWVKYAFFIDVNGSKAPNKYGYDMFHVVLHKNATKLTDVPYPIWEKGGRRIKNMLLNNDDVNSSLFTE